MEKTGKQTWGAVLDRAANINAIPLAHNGRSVEGSALASLILLQVDYGRVADEWNARINKATEKLKEQLCADYDEQMQLKEEERREGFAEESGRLNTAFRAMLTEEEGKECPHRLRGLTRTEFEAVCSMGAEGTVKLGQADVPMAVILRTVANLVEEEGEKKEETETEKAG